MKDKMLFLIIGILIGAIITTGIFMIKDKNTKPNEPNRENIRSFDIDNLPEEFNPNNIPEKEQIRDSKQIQE